MIKGTLTQRMIVSSLVNTNPVIKLKFQTFDASFHQFLSS